jgi:hypothetical protein
VSGPMPELPELLTLFPWTHTEHILARSNLGLGSSTLHLFVYDQFCLWKITKKHTKKNKKKKKKTALDYIYFGKLLLFLMFLDFLYIKINYMIVIS